MQTRCVCRLSAAPRGYPTPPSYTMCILRWTCVSLKERVGLSSVSARAAVPVVADVHHLVCSWWGCVGTAAGSGAGCVCSLYALIGTARSGAGGWAVDVPGCMHDG